MSLASRCAISRAARVGFLCALVWLSSNSALTAQTFEMHRVSVSSDGVQANKVCSRPDISHDGRFIVFESASDNLVAGDDDGVADVFLHDLMTGDTVCASVGADGLPAGGTAPAISGDGHSVVFISDQLHVTSEGCGTCAALQVFIFRRDAATVRLVSASAAGDPADQACFEPKVTFDGRYVAFRSHALNLVQKDYGDAWFIADLRTGTLSYGCYECPGYGKSFHTLEAMSSDGSYLSHTYSDAEGIEGPHDSLTSFLADPYTTSGWFGPIEIDGCDYFDEPIALSFDGRYVVHTSVDIHCTIPLLFEDFMVQIDRLTGAFDFCNVKLDGTYAGAGLGSISPDGRYVTFEASDGGLVAGDTNGIIDLFLRDTISRTTTRISMSATGEQANSTSGYGSGASATANGGTFVAFSHDASTLVPGDTNGVADIFVFDRDPWFDLGSSLAGVAGAPRLAGLGSLEPAASCLLRLSHAAPSAVALLFVSLQPGGAAFKGGVLVAFPPAATLPLATNSHGDFELPFPGPALISGVALYLQCAVQDAAAPQGVALSNAVRAVAP